MPHPTLVTAYRHVEVARMAAVSTHVWPPIAPSAGSGPPPRLADYDAARAAFRWEDARAELAGVPGHRGLNIADEALDRHVREGRGHRRAILAVGRHGETSEVTYAQLAAHTSRFANVLRGLRVGPGERVFSLMGRQPALFIAALGTLKATSVFCPLFSAFGPEPVRDRLVLGNGRVLVTTPALYRRKVEPVRDQLPELEHVLLVGGDPETARSVPGGIDLAEAMDAASEEFAIPPTDPDTPALLHFTSGTTGRPKGAVHAHEAVVVHRATAQWVLDLGPDDVFWCTADPGWVTGMSYGVIAPLSLGATVVTDARDYDALRWYSLLQDQRVTVWYTAPTALRMLMRAGEQLPRRYDLSALRHIASVGEPLNPEVVVWGRDALGLPVHDNWWQTETGAIMVANYRCAEVRPGSMGRPVPGIETAVLERGEDGRAQVGPDGHVRVLTEPGLVGELALQRGWPSMFRGYLHDEQRYAASFADGWYLTGDLVRVDGQGYHWFVGRADDVIKSAGHLVGPFEVETALMEHPAVAEAGVIGKPDPVAGEVVKAFVTVRDGFTADDALREELLSFARRRLGAVAPKEVDFDQHLPHTRSGKVMRRLLRARELGLEEGDTSTLEPPA
ncbi:acetate--CoA ligase [Oryzihumus sp.]